MMRRTLVLLATMTLVVVASGSLAVAASSLNNGNFETGDLTGWSVDTTNGGDASVVNRYDYWENLACLHCVPVSIPRAKAPHLLWLVRRTRWQATPRSPNRLRHLMGIRLAVGPSSRRTTTGMP
jgi:hypothetical protein